MSSGIWGDTEGVPHPSVKFSWWVVGALVLNSVSSVASSVGDSAQNVANVCLSFANYDINRLRMAEQASLELEALISEFADEIEDYEDECLEDYGDE